MPQQATDPVKPSSAWRWLGYVQIVLIILAVAVALYFARAPARIERGPVSVSGEELTPVQVVVPALAEHVPQLSLTGMITLDRKLTVVSEVTGKVSWVSQEFVNGGLIPANEVFVRIDPREYELKVRAAEMALAEAEARLQLARTGTGENSGVSVAVAEASLGQASASLDLARLQLARTEISLPFAARVMSSELEVGDLVGPPEEVGKLAVLGIVYRPEALQVRVPISVEELAALDPAIGRAAQVDTVSGLYDAELARVSSAVSAKTRLARVFLKFSSGISHEALPLPGTFAGVRIFGSRRDNVFALPEAAAREHDSVWIVSDGALRAIQPVTVGRTAEGWIVEEFDPGDGVVVGALAIASEGLKVTPLPASQ